MKDFIANYWKELIALVCFLLEITISIILLVKRNKKESPVISEIVLKLPSIISHAEKVFPSGNGASKLELVLSVIDKLFKKETGNPMTKSESKFFVEKIEEILSTPQKKGKN